MLLSLITTIAGIQANKNWGEWNTVGKHMIRTYPVKIFLSDVF